jgi:sigma-E factor negative regulatory protein RseA
MLESAQRATEPHGRNYHFDRPLNFLIMTSTTPTCELISALADGQLSGELLDEALRRLASDEVAIASWREVHLIGDALRAPASTPVATSFNAGDSTFLARFNQRLAAAQPQGANGSIGWAGLMPAPQREVVGHAAPSANDRWFGWKLAAGFATLAAVSTTVWMSLAAQGVATPVQLSEQSMPSRVLVASPQGVIVRDARLNELLAAHKQLGAGSALQASSGFLQSAAFETTPVNER